MNKTEKLNRLFMNRIMKRFIPLVNPVVTFLNNGSVVRTHYNCKKKTWIHKEGKVILSVDINPNWNISYKTMAKSARAVCCKNYFPKKNDIVIDLGAGVGFETILFQRLVGESGIVYAVEAHPETASMLEYCIQKNGFSNVVVSRIAIGGSSGFTFIENRSNHAANSIGNILEDGIQIPIMTLDDFIREKNISRIDFIKINIEGSEEDAIDGMNKSIKIIKNIAVSCHDFLEKNPGNRIRKKMINFLQSNNFEVMESDDLHVVRRSWIYGENRTIQ